MKRLTLVSALAALAVQPLSAAVVDQSSFFDAGGYPLQLSSIATVPGGLFRMQAHGVTAGMSGLLSRVDLLVAQGNGTGTLVLSLGHGLVTDAGYANAVSLVVDRASIASYTDLNNGGFTSIDVSALGFNVSAGQQFTIHLAASQDSIGNRFGWAFGNDIDGNGTVGAFADYAGGDNHVSEDGGNSWSVTGFDRGFRTWVEAGAVPEPATWAMLIAGFGLIGAAIRRQRPAAA